MLEQLAVYFGRNITLRGSGRLLSMFYPCKHNADRYVHGVRARADGLLMEVDSRSWIDWNLLFRGEYEPHITCLFRRLASVGGVAVDIGANIGTHTLTLAQILGPTGTVLAFEPNPLVRSVLERNVALNGFLGAHVFDCALGNKPSILPLRVPKADSFEYSNMGLTSLVALDTPHNLVEVQVCTLDDIVRQAGLTRVDLVKIDVQGYECRVLAGMQEVLANHSPVVIFEHDAWAWAKAGATLADAIALFQRTGYSLWRLGSGREASIKLLGRIDLIPPCIDLLALKRDDSRLDLLLSEAPTWER